MWVVHEYYFDLDSVKSINKDSHRTTYKCIECGETKEVTDPHNFEITDWQKKYLDADYHVSSKMTCYDCGYETTGDDKEEHNWVFEETKNGDKNNHVFVYRCYECNKTKEEKEAHNYGDYVSKVESCDNDYHIKYISCDSCETTKAQKEAHNWEYDSTVEANNNQYHYEVYRCTDCDATKNVKKDHTIDYDEGFEVDKYATLKSKGIISYPCQDCGDSVVKKVSWKRGTDYSVSYGIKNHTIVYRKSKTITVTLKRPVKGAVLKVKVGKKTYSKKIKNNKKKVKIKIKKPKYGSKVSFKLYMKRKLIGVTNNSDWDNYVYYAKDIKKGMTRKQVGNLYYWGYPDSTSSASGGWKYWNYEDGSYVAFRKGKVKHWYNAAR